MRLGLFVVGGDTQQRLPFHGQPAGITKQKILLNAIGFFCDYLLSNIISQ